jgi:hypothetical protein
MKKYSLTRILLVGILLVGCQSSESEKVIASEEGYALTQDHFKNYIARLEMQSGSLSFSEKDNERAKLLDFFYADPEGTLEELRSIAGGEISKSTLGDDDIQTLQEDSYSVQELGDAGLSSPVQASKSIANNLAQGHKEVRRLLGGDIGEMQFDTQAANTFRSYVANSLLTTTSSNANRGYNSSDYTSSQGQIQFCANGTFVEVLSGHLSIDVEGASAMSSGSDSMPGYWEAAALPNGMLIILMYSTHPRMLEDSPNGFLPFVVTKHGPDFVQLPSGDLYRRNANQYCY